MDVNQIVISLTVAFIAAAPGVIALIAQRKKTDAETDTAEMVAVKLRVETSDIIRKATAELSDQYRKEKESLQGLVLKLEVRIGDLQDELRDAYVEIRRLNEALKQSNRKDM